MANGWEVLTALRQFQYDLILMDCQMPDLDGYEATRAIRQAELDATQPCAWASPIRIVALTANAMCGDREKCLQAGMNDYVTKPLRLVELEAALERAAQSLRCAAPLARPWPAVP